MVYLAKLAKRISCTRMVAIGAVLGLGACSQAETKDFLNPNPNQIVPVAASIRIEPQLSIVAANQPTQFTATGISTTGQSMPVSVVWSSPDGVITSTGLFTGDRSGQFRVRAYLASNPGIQDSARAAVWEKPTDVVEVLVSPDSTVVEPGEGIKLEAIAKLANGVATETDGMNWAANGGQVDRTGLFSSLVVGDYVVTASATNGVKGDTRILVRPKTRSITDLSVTPAAITVMAAGTVQFTGTASYSDGTVGVLDRVIWSSTGGTISSSGLFTAGSTGGVFSVIGQERNGTHADTAIVTVQVPSVVGVTVAPGATSLAAGASQRFQATATYADGSSQVVSASWQATGGTINSQGSYTAGTVAGNYRVIASVPGYLAADTAEVAIVVPVATLTGVIITPSSLSLASGASAQFSVKGVWSDGSSTAPAVTWTATGGTISSAGLYAAGSVSGTFQVIARASNGVADTSAVSIGGAVLTSLSVTPASSTVLSGATQQFARSGVWSDGSTTAPTVSWTAGGGSISTSGLYTAGSDAGTYRVIAVAQGTTIADTSLVTVTVPTATLTGVLLSPGSALVAPGAAKQFSVSGTLSDGSTVVPAVTWSAMGGTISTAGLYTAGQTVGTYPVVAKATGSTIADTSFVSVTATTPVLSSVVISPSSASILTSGTKQFGVSATWSDGSTSTPAVTWTATGGTITNAGLYAAGTIAGTYRVIATVVGGTTADTSAVTVSAPNTLTAVVVSPASVATYPGAQSLLSAWGQYSSGTTAPLPVTWTATGGSISSSGVYTAGASTGLYQVIGTDPVSGKADTSAVTIGAAPAPGQYQTVAAQDWSLYPDKTTPVNGVRLYTLFGVEGGLNTQAPALPTSAFYDLVSESVPDGFGGMISGKAVRYLGDPALNTTDPTQPGRIALHKVNFADLNDVWVRQYVKFSTNWTTHGTKPIGAADAYKFMFFRFDGADFRLGHILQGARNEIMELGQGPNGSRPGAVAATLPWDNHVAVSPADGAYGMDAHPMIKGGDYMGPPFSPGGDGDGEWYEIVLRFKKTDVMVMQGTVAKRRVTLGGVWNPGPWIVIARQVTHTGDPTIEYIRPVYEYDMGVNRNKQWDNVMWIDWGKYEVVNGARYANPFNVPNVP